MTNVFSSLIDLIYEGPTEAQPWQRFAEALRVALAARNAVVTLHHVEGEGNDVYVMAGVPGDAIDWQAVEAIYRAEFMADDPLRPSLMKPGQVGLMYADNSESRQRAFAESLGIAHCLRFCCAEPGGTRCWVDVVRGHEEPDRPFIAAELALIQALTPHLARALGLYARLKRQEAEKTIYEGVLEHFALGCLLLNEVGAVIHINRIAETLMKHWPGISLSRGRLVLAERDARRALEEALAAIVATRASEGPAHDGTLIRVGTPQGRLLGLLVYPAPRQAYYRGAQAPCAIVYLSDPTASLEALRPAQVHSLDRLAQLFSLTRQEATLALLLAHGDTIAEAARDMGIAETAARNYSKKIYAKMGIASQTDLVRLVLRSFSFLR